MENLSQAAIKFTGENSLDYMEVPGCSDIKSKKFIRYCDWKKKTEDRKSTGEA